MRIRREVWCSVVSESERETVVVVQLFFWQGRVSVGCGGRVGPPIPLGARSSSSVGVRPLPQQAQNWQAQPCGPQHLTQSRSFLAALPSSEPFPLDPFGSTGSHNSPQISPLPSPSPSRLPPPPQLFFVVAWQERPTHRPTVPQTQNFFLRYCCLPAHHINTHSSFLHSPPSELARSPLLSPFEVFPKLPLQNHLRSCNLGSIPSPRYQIPDTSLRALEVPVAFRLQLIFRRINKDSRPRPPAVFSRSFTLRASFLTILQNAFSNLQRDQWH